MPTSTDFTYTRALFNLEMSWITVIYEKQFELNSIAEAKIAVETVN